MAFGESRRETSVAYHIDACYRLAVAMLGVGAAADSAVMSAFMGLDVFDVAPEALRRQLMAATRGAATEILRNALQRPADSQRADPQRYERALGAVSTDGTAARIANLPDSLTAAERTAVLLTYVGCYRVAEVALLTDTTPADVRRTLAAAARKLVDRRRSEQGAQALAEASDTASALSAMRTASQVGFIIEQATGMVMEADKCGALEARATLAALAAQTGRTLSAVATDMTRGARQEPRKGRRPSRADSPKR